MSIDEALELLDIDMDEWAEKRGWDGWDYDELYLDTEENVKRMVGGNSTHILQIGEYIPGDGSSHDPSVLVSVNSNGTASLSEEIYDEEGEKVIGHKLISVSLYDLRRLIGAKHLWYEDNMII